MNLALFDFDGTITRQDTFTGFIQYSVDPRKVRWGKVLFAPLVGGYKLGLVSGELLRSSVAMLAFRGAPESAVRQAGADYAREVIPSLVRPHALNRIAWHQAHGDVVVVVSASLDVYLTDWCRQRSMDLIATELESENGILTGRYRGGDCCGGEKRRRVLQRYRLSDFRSVYAYGDTRDDREMLTIADKRYYQWREV